MSDAEAPEVAAEQQPPAEEAAQPEAAAAEAADEQAAEAAPENGEQNAKRTREDEEAEEPPAKRPADEGAEGEEGAHAGGDGAGAGAVDAAAAAAAVIAQGAAPTEQSEVIHVPSDKVGKLIGRAGVTIKELQSRSSCRIKIDHNAPGETKPITIYGSTPAIQQCKALINEVLESDQPLAAAGETSRTMECPQQLVGRIIGRGGETIRSLQTASGAHIMVNQNFPDGVPRQIDLTGKPDAVERALAMINELIHGEPGSTQMMIQKVIEKHGVGVTRVMDCSKAMVGRIIGKGGETIKQLQKQYQASIQIDQSCNPCKITITGPAHAVQNAERAIFDVMEGGDGRVGGMGGMGGMAGMPMGGGMGGGFGGMRAPFPGGGYGGGGGFPQAGGYGGGFQQPAPAYGGGYGGAPAPAPGYGAPAPGYGAQNMYGGGGYGQAAAPAYGGGYGGGYPAQDPYGGAAQYGGMQQPAQQQQPSVWQEQHDDQGRTYYYNTQTGVSQWEKPADMP